MSETCKRHRIDFNMTCPACNRRDSYRVRGNVEQFDKGYEDGFAERPSIAMDIARIGHYQAAADYSDGYSTGVSYRPIKPRKVFAVVKINTDGTYHATIIGTVLASEEDKCAELARCLGCTIADLNADAIANDYVFKFIPVNGLLNPVTKRK